VTNWVYDPRARTARINASDAGLQISSPIESSATLKGQSIGILVDDVARRAGFVSSGDRDIDDTLGGSYQLDAFFYDPQKTALQQIKDLLTIERGSAWVEPDGTFKMLTSAERAARSPIGTLNPESYERSLPAVSTDNVVNSVTIEYRDQTSLELVTLTKEAPASISQYGKNNRQISISYSIDVVRANAIGDAILNEGKDRISAPVSTNVLANYDQTTLLLALSADLFDLITIRGEDYEIAGISHGVARDSTAHWTNFVLR